jgi:hypothetical protein
LEKLESSRSAMVVRELNEACESAQEDCEEDGIPYEDDKADDEIMSD